MENAISWFEIPTKDFQRAVKFYESIFGLKMQIKNFGNLKMALFPAEEGGIGGALIHLPEHYAPSHDGPLIYLNANPDLSKALSKVEDAGGKILKNKKQISPQFGFMALFEDSEGNRIALNSQK